MDAAVNMVNEFLPGDCDIVYAEGRSFPREEATSNGMGSFQEQPIIVLTDEWSASSSEIFAGAIQDNDRGLIVGRRTFGKGLVQTQFPFPDGSAVRLTVARYYTPSGRCIQKEYTLGDEEDYNLDIINRYNRGEFFNADSIHQHTELVYTTVEAVRFMAEVVLCLMFLCRVIRQVLPTTTMRLSIKDCCINMPLTM